MSDYEALLRGLGPVERENCLEQLHRSGITPSDPATAIIAVVAAHCRARNEVEIAEQQRELLAAYAHLDLAIRRVWVVTFGTAGAWALGCLGIGFVLGRLMS